MFNNSPDDSIRSQTQGKYQINNQMQQPPKIVSNQLPLKFNFDTSRMIMRPKTNQSPRKPLKYQRNVNYGSNLMSGESSWQNKGTRADTRNGTSTQMQSIQHPKLDSINQFNNINATNNNFFTVRNNDYRTQRQNETSISYRSTKYEAVTLRYSKHLLMNKMLNSKQNHRSLYDKSKFVTSTEEEEEFPLFGTDNSLMGGNSEMYSKTSGRPHTQMMDTGRNKAARANKSIDLKQLKVKPTFDLSQIEDYDITNNDFKSPKIVQRKPKSQFRKKLDEMIHIRVNSTIVEPLTNSIFENQDAQNKWVKSWKPDPKIIERQTYLKKRKLKNAMAKIKLIRMLFQVRKDKSLFLNAFKTLENDEFLQQVLVNDQIFTEQLKNVMPETRYYINKLLHNIDPKYLIKPKVGFAYTRKKTKLDLVSQFKAKMNLSVNIQQDKDLKFKRLGTLEKSLFQEFSKKKQNTKELGEKVKKRVIYDEEASECEDHDVHLNFKAQKVRKMIQKHFLTGYPHSLKKKVKTGYNFNFGVIEKLGFFKRAFDNNFEGGVTIGQKYMELRLNLFSYSYIEKVMSVDNETLKNQRTKKFNIKRDMINAGFNHSNAETLFNKEVMNQKFYRQVSITNPVICCETKLAIQQFFEKTQKEGEIVRPTFLQIQNNQVSMYEETISKVQANVLKTYFEKTKHLPSKKITALIVDNCFTSDENFAIILKGIQSQQDSAQKTLLNKFVFTNAKLGPASVKVLDNLMGSIKEIIINNIQTSMNKQVARDIINSILENGRNISKIRLSNMNLNDEKVVDSLCKVIQQYDAYIQSINLSNTHLTPKLLCKFSDKLKNEPAFLKGLDLSYNMLHFEDSKQDKEYSDQFIKNMEEFFSGSDLLNHVDFSGMNFNNPSILRMCESLSCCPNLMVVHLNDNNISDKCNHEFFTEVISIFDIIDSDNLTRQHAVLNDHHTTEAINELLISQQDKIDEKTNETINDNLKVRTKKTLKGAMIKLNFVKIENETILAKEVQDQLDQAQKLQQLAEQDHNKDLLDEEKLCGLSWIEAVDGRNKMMLKCIEDTEKQYLIDTQGVGAAITHDYKSRKNYKIHLIRSKESKQIQTHKIQQHTKRGVGIGRHNDSQLDYFVVSRKVNQPELIWNQNPKNDSHPDKQYFEVNACKKWELSQKNECFICDGHKYTIIFFKQGLYTQQNKGLYEVKDEVMLEFLRNNYQYNQAKGDVQTPIICGSVVNGTCNVYPYTRMNFERKLRLMRVELFSILLISQTQSFVKNIPEATMLMQGIVEYSKQDKYDQIEVLQIKDKLADWTEIIYDKCLLNELTDVHLENASNQDFDVNFQKGKNRDMFVYANYLKPGIHKFLIYCPVNKRAFVKTILVDVNTSDYYPEFPVKIKVPRKKLILNVWRQAKKETKEQLKSMCTNDTEHPGFNLGLVIRDPLELERVVNVVLLNYNQFRCYFIHFILMSENYPKIDYITALKLNEQNIQQDGNQIIPLSNEQLEIQFIRTVRNQVVNGIKGQMNRSEFVEFIIRIAISAFPKMSASLSLQVLIGSFLQPIFIKQTWLQERNKIQASRPLNKLLYENRNGLNYIYKNIKDRKMISKEESTQLMLDVTEDKVSADDLKKHFLNSIENIIEENAKTSNKYWYLEFHEFQEFLCRVALQLFPNEKELEYKVYKLFDLLYSHEGISDKAKADLLSPDLDITLVAINEDEEC